MRWATGSTPCCASCRRRGLLHSRVTACRPRPTGSKAGSSRHPRAAAQRTEVSVLTEITGSRRLAAMNLTPTVSRFVLHWGEMGARWGVNRSVAQIHALLFITGRPMHADELVEALEIARSNVSTSLRELQAWQLVRLVHIAGDRRDHFETSTDVWELLRTVVRERQQRE